MKIFTTIGNPGITLPCATLLATGSGWGPGMYGNAEGALSAGRVARLRHLVDGTRVFSAQTNADLPSAKQPPIRVSVPPLERSP
jgi:hypothetical protein